MMNDDNGFDFGSSGKLEGAPDGTGCHRHSRWLLLKHKTVGNRGGNCRCEYQAILLLESA